MKRKMKGVVLVALAVVAILMNFVVYPKMVELYSEVGQIIPQSVLLSHYLIWIFVAISIMASIYFFANQTKKNVIDGFTSKYKKDEMIHVRELKENGEGLLNLTIGVFLGLFVVAIVFSFIFPISSLTSKIYSQ